MITVFCSSCSFEVGFAFSRLRSSGKVLVERVLLQSLLIASLSGIHNYWYTMR